MAESYKTRGLFFLTILLVSLDRAKGKSVIPEGKIEIDDKLLEIGKLQYSSHPEVRKWQEVLRDRRKKFEN